MWCMSMYIAKLPARVSISNGQHHKVSKVEFKVVKVVREWYL